MTGTHATQDTRLIDVLVDQTLVGSLRISPRPPAPNPHIEFLYAKSWLEDRFAFAISPELPLISTAQQPTMGREIFGSFMDAAPDTWGQGLLHQYSRNRANDAGTPLPTTNAVARLLLVNDATRQGALRFREHGEFLASWATQASTDDLPDLAQQVRAYQDTGVIQEENSLLVAAGSSPGGARPKAWIRDRRGKEMLAKFPDEADRGNVQLWEMVAIELQQLAGIRVQPSRLFQLNSYSHVFLTQRFDRSGTRRLPYMSARTALQLGTLDRPNYVSLAREISDLSAAPDLDAPELFSRAAFGAMVNNIDDHMRNHGLLRQVEGWRLAPSFDVNPMSDGFSETPLIPGGDPRDRNVLELLNHLDSFRLNPEEATDRLKKIAAAISHWALFARRLGAEPDEVDSMRNAFEGPNIRRVGKL